MYALLYNILQVEFFHTNNKPRSFDTFVDQMNERFADGAALKTVIRLYDVDQSLTRFVQDATRDGTKRAAARAVAWKRASKSTYVLASSIKNFRLTRKVVEAQTGSLPLALQSLALAIEESRPIAVECHDRSFRLVDKSELHELLESARAATDVWLFIFKPNDLLADKNEMIGKYMNYM